MLGHDDHIVSVSAHFQQDILQEEPGMDLVVERGELVDDDALVSNGNFHGQPLALLLASVTGPGTTAGLGLALAGWAAAASLVVRVTPGLRRQPLPQHRAPLLRRVHRGRPDPRVPSRWRRARSRRCRRFGRLFVHQA